MLIFKNNIILGLILGLSFFILINNAFRYPVLGGYDAARHIKYAQIISEEFRLPGWEETNQAYNPPLFYLISGSVIKLYSLLSGRDFIGSINIWLCVVALLTIISFWLWYKIYLFINPQEKKAALFFVLFLASVPAVNKAAAMYFTESFNLFLATVIIWFFVGKFLKNPNYRNNIVLSLMVALALLTRITFLSLAAATVLGIFFVAKSKKIRFPKIVNLLLIYFLIIVTTTAWFYFAYAENSQKLFKIGEYEPEKYKEVPIYKRQRPAFYYDVPFQLTMTYPVRPHLSRPSYLLPIYYSEFWGDYWNYFSQRRFGLELAQLMADRQFFPEKRIAYLAWQNRINLIPSLLMVAGFVFLLTKRVANFMKGRIDLKNTAELFLMSLVLLSWGAFLTIASRYPGEGDWIKPSYTLFVIPVYVYFMSLFLFSHIKKNIKKFIFWAILVVLLFSIINNFFFVYF